MMKISPFTPLFFSPSKDKYGICSKYVQKFAPSDKILIEVLSDGTDVPLPLSLENLSTGWILSYEWQYFQLNTGLTLYYKELTELKEGYYSVYAIGLGSESFKITRNTNELDETTLIKYSMEDNKQRADAIFLIDGTRRFFEFRAPGGFCDDNWVFEVDNEQFTSSDGNIVELYSLEMTQKSFTLGTNIGCPIWYADLLNRILSCTYVYFDNVRFVRKGNSVPEINILISGMRSYVFKQALQQLNDQTFGGTSATYTIAVNIDASSIGKCTIEATGDVVSITPLADGSSYSVVGNADGMVTVKIVTEAGYQVKGLSVDQVAQGAISEYIFDKLTIDHTMYIILEEASTEFLERSDLPGYYYSSMQDALNAVRATYPDGLTRNVTISCMKSVKEKRKGDHYLATLSNWNQRSMYALTIDGNNDLYLDGKSLGCLSFSNVDNIIIKDTHFEDYSNYVGYQVPDALGAISFTGKASKYSRNLFIGGCTFNGKSMTNEEIMSTNSVILIDAENVTINNSSFINGCGPIVNADSCNLLSVINNDFAVAPIGVGYPTAVTVNSGKMVIMEDNRMSGDNRYSFVAVTNVDKAYIRRNTFKDGGSMALSISSSVPMSKLVLESNLFAGMLSNTSSINTWAQTVVGLCPIRDMELNNNTFYMSGNNGQQYCTRWGSINRLKMYNNVVVDAKHAVNFVYGFAFNDVGELFSDHNVFQYKVHNNVTYGSLIRVYNSEGIEGAVEINADQGCRFAQIQALGYDTHSVLVSDGVDADALDGNMMITSALDQNNPANNDYVPAIDLAYKSQSASVNSRGCYNLHGSVINEAIVVDGYTGYNMESDSTFSDAAQYSSMAEDMLLLMSKSLNRNLMPSFSIEGPADRFLIIGRYGLLSPIPILDENGEYVEDELYDITIE